MLGNYREQLVQKHANLQKAVEGMQRAADKAKAELDAYDFSQGNKPSPGGIDPQLMQEIEARKKSARLPSWFVP